MPPRWLRWGALVVALAAVTPAGAADFFVAPDGRDAWSGRLPAPHAAGTDGPFATLERARDAARGLKEAVTVHLRGGTYALTRPLVLEAADGGAADSPRVWRAYRDERVTLLGSAPVAGFRPVGDGLFQADLSAPPLAGVAIRQIFSRGQRLVLARYPNLDPTDPHGGVWAHVLAVDGPGIKDHFTATADVVKAWTNVALAELAIHPSYGWAWNVLPLRTADPATGVVTVARPAAYDLAVGDRYFVQNLREELDAPGEWYLDRAAGRLSLKPLPGDDLSAIRAAVSAGLLELRGAHHVTLRGFRLEECAGDAVRLTDCESSRVAGCTIRNTGGWGVVVRGGARSGACGCDISATGSGGVAVSGGNRDTLEPAGNYATNNVIHHIAAFQKTYHTGVNLSGVGNLCSHNLIHDCYHQGILVGGNDQTVEYNVVHHTNLGSEDTGGLYMSSRDYSQRGTVIRHNVFHHVGGFGKVNSWQPVQHGRVRFAYPQFTWGVYLDAPETGVTVFGNVFYEVPVCAMFNHSGKDNTWENNVVIDAPAFRASTWGRDDLFLTSWGHLTKLLAGPAAATYLARYPELKRYDEREPRRATMFNCRFRRNIVYFTPDGARQQRDQNRAAWEGGQLLWSWRGHRDDFAEFRFDQNLVHAPPGLDLKVELTRDPEPRRLLSWEAWRATGQDAGSLLADPEFVDVAGRDFRLRPTSPALRLAFQPIPFERIGPYADELRASWPVVEAPGAAALGSFTTVRDFPLPGYEPVPATELAPRHGLPHLAARLAAGEPVTVVCFAGGNHAQGGWFAAWAEAFRQRYPRSRLRTIPAAIDGGARGSRFSLFRLGHEVLRHQPDLVFVDFASDDAEASAETVQAAAEGLVRQAWATDPRPDLVFVYAFRLGYEQDYAQGQCPAAVAAWERIAGHYGIPALNVGLRVDAAIRSGTLALRPVAGQPAGRPVFTTDGVYTSPEANRLYAAAVSEGLGALVEPTPGPAAPRAALGRPFGPSHLAAARQVALTPAMLSGSWTAEPPGAFAQHFERIWVTREPGAKLTFRFRGSEAALFNLMGPDTGQVRITIDGREVGIRRQVDRWAYYQRLTSLYLASNLSPEVHTVVVELLSEPPNRSEPMAEAQRLNRFDATAFEGVALRVGWIRVVGELVE